MNFSTPKSDIWSESQLLEAKKEFEKPRSVRELFSWLHHDDTDFDLVREASTCFPLNYKNIPDHPINLEKFTVANIAKIVSVDLKSISDRIFEAAKDITANTAKIGEHRYGSAEHKFQTKSGFTNLTHVIKTADYPELEKIGDLFGFDYYSTAIQYQPPGCIIGRHVDFLDSMWYNFEKTGVSVLDLPYNTFTKSPQGYYAIRVMVAMNDWYPGQIFGFHDEYWTNWKIGDVVTFDWAHVKHYTGNSSYLPRMYLKISGVTKNKNHWIFDNLNTNSITQL